MPTFCRHGRMQANCPICSKRDAPAKPVRAPRAVRTRTAAPRAKASTGMKVRRVVRAADDGYDNELVAGLRATSDAVRLASEIAFAEARLDELAADPPGLYAQVAGADDPEEACWLAFLIAYVGPGRGPEAFASVEAARVSWASGEMPSFAGAEGGPRSSLDPARAEATIVAYRARAARSGGQRAALLGEPDWEPERRFARTYERLGLPGFGRAGRFELLTSLGALGVVPVAAGSLLLGAEPTDPVVVSAKRVFGIGDAINLERRAKDLAAELAAPTGALDLALFNWNRDEAERATMGARVAADEDRVAEIAAILGVAAPDEDGAEE